MVGCQGLITNKQLMTKWMSRQTPTPRSDEGTSPISAVRIAIASSSQKLFHGELSRTDIVVIPVGVSSCSVSRTDSFLMWFQRFVVDAWWVMQRAIHWHRCSSLLFFRYRISLHSHSTLNREKYSVLCMIFKIYFILCTMKTKQRGYHHPVSRFFYGTHWISFVASFLVCLLVGWLVG